MAESQPPLPWNVRWAPPAERWYASLAPRQAHEINRALDRLRAGGPDLGRKTVDHIKGSRHGNLKELRTPGATLRVLFAFDPAQTAIMLVGGDKRGRETRWYRSAIRLADQEFDQHLIDGAREGRWRLSARVAGRGSEPRGR